MQESNYTDILILGAGIAGLSAGLYLKDQKQLNPTKITQNFTILEARDRPGGRIYSYETDKLPKGLRVDLGAGWIGHDHEEIYKIVDRYNLHDKLILQVEKGKNILRLDSMKGQQKTYSGIIPPFPILDLLFYEFKKRKLDKMVEKINLSNVYESENAKKYDNIKFADFLKETFGSKPDILSLFQKALSCAFGSDFDEISLLFALFYIKSNRNIDYVFDNEGGGQQHKIKGGTSHLIEPIANELKQYIKYNSQIQQITKLKENLYQVQQTNGIIYQAAKIIVTIPARVLNKLNIQFNNFTPNPEIQIQQKYQVGGHLLKCWCIYKEPFWQQQGFSGMALTVNETVTVTYDCSQQGYGLLMGFVTGNNAIEFIKKDEKTRQQIVLECLSKSFGERIKTDLIYYQQSEYYKEDFTQGCPIGLLKVGAYTALENLKKQNPDYDKNVQFIGTEFSTHFNGYMEGAFRTGKQAIQQIIGQENITTEEKYVNKYKKQQSNTNTYILLGILLVPLLIIAKSLI